MFLFMFLLSFFIQSRLCAHPCCASGCRVPQRLQKRLPGETSAPHPGQRDGWVIGLPQWLQNRASLLFFAPHAPQDTIASGLSGRSAPVVFAPEAPVPTLARIMSAMEAAGPLICCIMEKTSGTEAIPMPSPAAVLARAPEPLLAAIS